MEDGTPNRFRVALALNLMDQENLLQQRFNRYITQSHAGNGAAHRRPVPTSAPRAITQKSLSLLQTLPNHRCALHPAFGRTAMSDWSEVMSAERKQTYERRLILSTVLELFCHEMVSLLLPIPGEHL